jgi:hypothetical protein
MAASRRMPGEPPARGATAQEVAGADTGEAIAINGGPGTVWALRAYAAFRELAGESSG